MTENKHFIEDFFGTKIADPFRCLEDDKDSRTQEFIKKQNAETRKFIDGTDQLKHYSRRIKELWNFEKIGVPVKNGEYYYFLFNDGLQNQPLLMRSKNMKSVREEAEELINPNLLDENKTTAISVYKISPDGRFLVYGLSAEGSDWLTFYIRDLDSGENLPEKIQYCKFTTISFLPDSSGFVYSGYTKEDLTALAPGQNRLYLHTIGTDQEEDSVIYSGDNTGERYAAEITGDGEYLLLAVTGRPEGGNSFYYSKMKDMNNFHPLIVTPRTVSQFLGNDGSKLYFLTNENAGKRAVLSIDTENGERKFIVPEGMDVLAHAAMTKKHFVLATLHNAYHRLMIYSLSGSFIRNVDLPGIGAISALEGNRENDEVFFDFASFLYPPTLFHCDCDHSEARAVFSPKFDFDFSDYETYQIFFTSKDGTQVPMFISHKKGLVKDGNNKAYLYSYGGFNIARIPEFKASDLAWLEQGNIFAVANLRGGSEYGEEWHRAGMLENKQNVFDDFIAAAEYLIAEGYTSRKLLAIKGRSNGGLLTAACILQRPDLYGAVVSQVPVIDMFRYQLFTAGRYWVPEYGSATADAEQFSFLYRYSPLHNIRYGTVYPPLLVTTGAGDDRVVPMHSYKFVATLQKINLGDNPILLRVDFGAGHGAGKPTEMLIAEEADIYSFIDSVLSANLSE